MPAQRRSKTEVRAGLVRQWEDKSGKNAAKIERVMTATFIRFIRRYKKLYPSEHNYLLNNRENFCGRIYGVVSSGLFCYIENDIGRTRKVSEELNRVWRDNIKSLRQAEMNISKISKHSTVTVKTDTRKVESRHITWQVREALAHAITLSESERKLWEQRGVKPSGAALLALELFDWLEWCFKRKIAYNFDIYPSERDYQRNKQGGAPDFVNPDIKLIYQLVSIVEKDVSVGHVRQALNRLPRRHP